MRKSIDKNLIFALDIGTRSVIGVLGTQEDNLFKVQHIAKEEYKNRAVVDGQIEDIAETAKIAKKVKISLEKKIGHTLKNVYIAAAGRVLKTVETEFETAVPEGDPITDEFISKLEKGAIKKAYEILFESDQNIENVFYCVGHSVKYYTLDGYSFSNLIDHKGEIAGVSVIVTFLPKEVVESLYAAMARINLTVAGFTLEPIAAMNVIIPNDLRKLNLALCDIGAGTSDIALCDKGTVTAYAMATIAGDEITEQLMQECLVDFDTAENIKNQLSDEQINEITYTDILGIENKKSVEEMFSSISSVVDELATEISNKILETNGKPPQAVFLVGGGSRTKNLGKIVAEKIGVPESRVAVGSKAHMVRTVMSADKLMSPEYVTPLGIAITAAKQKEADTFSVTVNNEKIHLLNSWDTSVLSILQMSGYKYSQIIARAGMNLIFELNDKRKTIYGELSKPSEIKINGKKGTISDTISAGDVLDFIPAENGIDATAKIKDIIKKEKSRFSIELDGIELDAGQSIKVNNRDRSFEYQIKNGDSIVHRNIKTLLDLCEENGVPVKDRKFFIDETEIEMDYVLSEGDQITTVLSDDYSDEENLAFTENVQHSESPSLSNIPLENSEKPEETVATYEKQSEIESSESVVQTPPEEKTAVKEDENINSKTIKVILNGRALILEERVDGSQRQFFDLLAYTDIDPKNPKGDIVQKLNGRVAAYTEILHDGDKAEIYWNKN